MKQKQIFNVVLGEINGEVRSIEKLTLKEIKIQLPIIILNEGRFWKGLFWQMYHFLFCMDQNTVYFISDDEFSWEKVVNNYPELWNNQLLINFHKAYQRDNRINYLLDE